MKNFSILFLIFTMFTLNLFSKELVLTPNEKEFIKKHPTISLAGGKGFDPFLIQNQDGTVDGYDADIAKLIQKKTGLKIKFVLGDWSEIQKKALKRELDGLSTSAKTKTREPFYNFSMPYISTSNIIIVNKQNKKVIQKISDLTDKTAGVQEGNQYYTNLTKALKNVKIKYYKNQLQLIKALVSNEVDFIILDESAFYIARSAGLENFLKTAFALGKPNDLLFALRNDYPELVSIFNKVLINISEKEKNDIRHKWFNLQTYKHINLNKDLIFTQEEQDYLRSTKEIKLCGSPTWLPYSYTSGNNNVGIANDIYKIIQSKLSINMTFVHSKDWSGALELLKKRECDVINFALDTPQRRTYLNFTDSFIKVPLVIVTKVNVAFIYSLEDIIDKNIGIAKNSAYIELLKKDYPNIKITIVEDVKDGLDKLKDEKIFAYIGALPAVANSLKDTYIGELKITGKLDKTFNMGSGVRNDDLMLLSILNKIINSIEPYKIDRIMDKWISLKYEVGYDYKILWKIIAVLLFIAFAILYRQNNLKKLNKKLQEKTLELENAKKELMHSQVKLEKLASQDSLTSLYNRRKFDELFEVVWDNAIHTKTSIAIGMIDIDYFKRYNDTYGHKAGDKALIAVAKEIEKSLHRSKDIVARYGGEEFIVLISDIDEIGLEHILNNICTNIKNLKIPHEESSVLKYVSVSVGGVIGYPKSNDSAQKYFIDADKLLYEAKNKGRNQIVAGTIDF